MIKFGEQLWGMYRRYLSRRGSFLSPHPQPVSGDVSSRSVLAGSVVRLTEWTFVKRFGVQVAGLNEAYGVGLNVERRGRGFQVTRTLDSLFARQLF